MSPAFGHHVGVKSPPPASYVERKKSLSFGRHVDGMSLAFAHHAINEPLTSASHAGDTSPTSGNHVGNRAYFTLSHSHET